MEYQNRARRTADNVYVYWITVGAADPTMAASTAPSPAGDYGDVVVASRRSVAAEIRQESLTAQVDGSTSTFTTSASYVPGTLVVRWNGQIQALADVTENSASTFILSLTPDSGDGIEVAYRPA